MYFETNQVNDILICDQCEGRLDIPKILPCGKTICSFCAPLNLLSTIDYKFDCLVCKNKHEVPKDGLLINEALLKMLSIKPTRISRGYFFDSLQKSLDEIQNKRGLIKLGIENSTDLGKEHCIDLRNSVQLAAEEVILQVNDFSTKIIEEINEYEKGLIEFNKKNTKSLDAFYNIDKELESFHTINSEYLKQNVIDDEMIKNKNEEANNLIKKAEAEIKSLKTVIFDGKIISFEKNDEKINKLILGSIIYNRIESLNNSEIKKLFFLCEFTTEFTQHQNWNLIYRASQDGFEAANFHEKCDNKPSTFIIIKSENGNVFGGYTEQSWSGKGYKHDRKAFIFSMINQKNKPLKMNSSGSNSIYCCKHYGPTFGGYGYNSTFYDTASFHNVESNSHDENNHDFMIVDKSNINTKSYSDLGHSFRHPKYGYGLFRARSFLAGSHKFKILEIEVFSKI
jgi:hypothetical protein